MNEKKSDLIALSKKSKFIVLSVIIVALATLTTISIIKYRRISKHGVFVVATIQQVTTRKGRSGSVHSIYNYKGKEFKAIFLPASTFGRDIGRKFFVKVLPAKPWQYDYYDITVPECALKANPSQVWKELPDCDD